MFLDITGRRLIQRWHLSSEPYNLDYSVRCGVSSTMCVYADALHWYLATLPLSFWNKAIIYFYIKIHTVDPATNQQMTLMGRRLGCDD